ncbi:MAG: SPFH domain-containing protein [Kiritimatiellae bacterium]|nr:SPFH domain-containing protein [Kiritimatiellia bacterium]
MPRNEINEVAPAKALRNYMPWIFASRGVLALMILVVLLPLWFWFFCRIEPGPGEMAILIHKTGKDLPSGEILATKPEQKGIRLEVLPEGRYFRNPYSWGWQIKPITDIPAGKVCVQTRLYGRELTPGKIIAEEGSKGIISEVLRPGKYRINPYAYHVRLFDAINIRAGSVGVVDSLIGLDALNDNLPPEQRNQFLVSKGMKGVLSEVLDPGTYYLNPYLYTVAEVNLQSQRFELSGEDAITFLTMDGFTVNVEGTIEFALNRDKAALLTHRVGDMDDIVRKVIMPRARGFSRLEGSKNPAINYIGGETRQKFQDSLEVHLRDRCKEWGVTIKSVLVRNIIVPEEIASIIRDREVAVQNAKKFEQQIAQARSKAELTRQEMLAEQNREKVTAETARIRAVIAAKQEQEVRTVTARKDFEVAKLENETAAFQAQSILLKADADRDVIRLNNKAQADVFAAQAKAFGTGLNYARYIFYQRVGPRIRNVISSDESGGWGALFQPLLPASKEGGAR